MALDPRIILAGQTPDTIGAYGRGLGVGQARNQIGRENALAQLYAAQGPGIIAGETGALNALAGMDPMAALGVQGQRLGMDATRQSMGLQADAAKRAAAEYARSITAEQRAAEAAKLESGLKGAAFFYQKQDRAGYDGFLRQSGLDPAQFPFDQFPATAAQVGGVLDVLKGFEPKGPELMTVTPGSTVFDKGAGKPLFTAPDKPAPAPAAPTGFMWVDPANPAAGVKPIPGFQASPADEYQRYVQEETAAGRAPVPRIQFDRAKKGEYRTIDAAEVLSLGLDPKKQWQRAPDGQVSEIGGGGVTVNTGENTGDFAKKADQIAATRLGAVVEAGQSAQAFMGDIQALASLAGQLGTGRRAEIISKIGPLAEMAGIPIDGLTEMQAFEAIKDRLVPQMRPPGSGAASDFDARQFLSSLPSLGRTPDGNRIINDTLQSLYQHRISAAEIANQAFSGNITWQQADRDIAALGNPYETFNKSRGRIEAGVARKRLQVDGFTIEAVE